MGIFQGFRKPSIFCHGKEPLSGVRNGPQPNIKERRLLDTSRFVNGYLSSRSPFVVSSPNSSGVPHITPLASPRVWGFSLRQHSEGDLWGVWRTAVGARHQRRQCTATGLEGS